MSSYIVDPVTLDYLLTWAEDQRRDPLTAYLDAAAVATIPATLRAQVGLEPGFAGRHACWRLNTVDLTVTGQLLMMQNVRSVQANYPTCAPDDLPGPVDQRRVFGYRFQRLNIALDPSWVIQSCNCLRYQSCETEDWDQSAAARVLDTIRESAIRVLVKGDAPWGVSREDIAHLPQQITLSSMLNRKRNPK